MKNKYYKMVCIYSSTVLCLVILYFWGVGVTPKILYQRMAYKVIFVVDERDYRQNIRMVEIEQMREKLARLDMIITDIYSKPVEFFTYGTEGGAYVHLENNQLPIARPIIIDRWYDELIINIIKLTEPVATQRVNLKKLLPIENVYGCYILPIKNVNGNGRINIGQ